MNILVDTLPDSVEIGDKPVPIYTDFRTCLRVILANEADDLTPQEKQAVTIACMYPKPPRDAVEALQKAVRFLNGGKESAEADTTTVGRLFSFGKDANLIYAAFRQTHNVDLTTADLHWWQFLALFMDLGQDTTFCQLTALRSRVKSGKATKEERQTAREMGEVFDVPDLDKRTLEEKEAEREFMKLVGGNK